MSGKDINFRLQELYDQLCGFECPDVVTIEEIKGSHAHDYLKYAIGVSMAAVRTPVVITVPINVWKKVAKLVEGYHKTDENDAIVMGQATVLRAQELYDADKV